MRRRDAASGKKIGLVRFVLEQLAGAGFALSLFALILLHMNRYDLYRWSGSMTASYSFFRIFYGYGLACSLGIALLAWLFPRLGFVSKVVLYAAAGFAYFAVREMDLFHIIAGLIASVFALLFFAGTRLAARDTAWRWGTAIFVPLVLLVLVNIDYTVKRGWTETASPGRFEASFTSFNGKHEIPIEAEQGQRIVFRVTWDRANGGGHGMHVLNEAGKYAGMKELGDGRYAFDADRSGTYRIVLTGDHLRGKFRVDWEIETDSSAGGA